MTQFTSKAIEESFIRLLNEDVERVLSQHLDMDSWEEGFISAARFALENKRLVIRWRNIIPGTCLSHRHSR